VTGLQPRIGRHRGNPGLCVVRLVADHPGASMAEVAQLESSAAPMSRARTPRSPAVGPALGGHQLRPRTRCDSGRSQHEGGHHVVLASPPDGPG
jgi:hypothetical protein